VHNPQEGWVPGVAPHGAIAGGVAKALPDRLLMNIGNINKNKIVKIDIFIKFGKKILVIFKFFYYY
jgi:hypothetical protein